MRTLSPTMRQYVAEWSKDFNMKRVAGSLHRSIKTVDWALRKSRRTLGLPSLHHLAAWTVRGLGLVVATTALAQPPMPPAPKFGPTTNLSSVTLAWDASPGTNAAGYAIYQGISSRSYTNRLDAGTNLTLTVSNLVRGVTNYFTATAYSATGLESDYSNEVAWKSDLPPIPPANLRITAQIAKSPTGPWQPFTNMPSVVITNPAGESYFRMEISKEK